MEQTDFRKCRRCLTRDMIDREEEFRSMREYIDNLDENIKADTELYENRLGICKECDMLLAGMCRSCGCYVEMRAAVKKNMCPRKKW